MIIASSYIYKVAVIKLVEVLTKELVRLWNNYFSRISKFC